jgi:hypothetical protein
LTSGTHLPRVLEDSNVQITRDGRRGALAQHLDDVAEYENSLIDVERAARAAQS